ncbi:MAG: flippase [Dehalococcoidia bacterium]|nr:flippase [Dehalococcoidia bacterium]
MTTAVLPGRVTLARNTLITIVGGAVPPLVGLAVVPLFVHGLGTERYGLWTLAGSIFAYFLIFDIGLGKATTKFVSEALARGEREEIAYLFWTALLASVALGVVAGVAFAAAVPFLTTRVLRIPSELVPEARALLLVFALSAPLHLCARAVGGLLEGSHRFDLSNAIGVPVRILGMVLPLLGVWLGWSLAGVGALAVGAGLIGVLVTGAVALRVRPEVRGVPRVSQAALRRLLGFGGWMMGVSILASLVAGSDRIIIGTVLSTSAVAYYAPPHSLIWQSSSIASALYVTLFPAFSALGSVDKKRMERLYASAFKVLMVIMGPIALLIIVFAREGLTLWLGADFAHESTRVLQVLAIGMFLNTLAVVPSIALQGAGRPDLVARIFLLEAPVYVGLAVLLTRQMGIVGMALAWTLRNIADAVLFSLTAWWALGLAPTLLLANRGVMAGVLLVGLAFGIGVIHLLLPASWILLKMVLSIGLLSIFAFLVLFVVLNTEERQAVKQITPFFRDNSSKISTL